MSEDAIGTVEEQPKRGRGRPPGSKSTLPEEWFTVRQAAEKLGLSVSNLYKIIAAKQIGYYKFGRVVRLTQAQLVAYLNEHLVGDGG